MARNIGFSKVSASVFCLLRLKITIELMFKKFYLVLLLPLFLRGRVVGCHGVLDVCLRGVVLFVLFLILRPIRVEISKSANFPCLTVFEATINSLSSLLVLPSWNSDPTV